MISIFFSTLVLVALTSPAHAFPDAWSFGCKILTTQRSDPLLSPGLPAGHVHEIVGGNAFSRSCLTLLLRLMRLRPPVMQHLIIAITGRQLYTISVQIESSSE